MRLPCCLSFVPAAYTGAREAACCAYGVVWCFARARARARTQPSNHCSCRAKAAKESPLYAFFLPGAVASEVRRARGILRSVSCVLYSGWWEYRCGTRCPSETDTNPRRACRPAPRRSERVKSMPMQQASDLSSTWYLAPSTWS